MTLSIDNPPLWDVRETLLQIIGEATELRALLELFDNPQRAIGPWQIHEEQLVRHCHYIQSLTATLMRDCFELVAEREETTP